MRIKVTQEDIDKGESGSARKCPMALASQRAFGVSDKFCTVGPHRISLYTTALDGTKLFPLKPTRSFRLPYTAVNFVRAFDFKEEVKPLEFDVEEYSENWGEVV